MLAAFVPAAAAAPAAEEHWAQTVIQDFIDRTYMTAGNTDPDASMTCGQFTDVIDEIIGSAAKGIMYTDVDAGTVLTREQAMTIVADLAGLTATDDQVDALAQFSDHAQISADARNAVAAMVAEGYINGTPDGSLMPRKELTVAEGITILSRTLDVLPFDLADYDIVYGKATLTFAEYYSGDVSSTDSYGMYGVSSATVNLYNSFNDSMHTNYTEDKTEGYNILGVKNVNVAASAEDYAAYVAINPTFRFTHTVPQQYKTVTVSNGKAVYSATSFNVVETVMDATATLKTGSTWGDYEIDVTETSTANIRNNRSDEGWAINAGIQGTILEAESGLRVGMEFLQSIWLQPWEVSFNVTEDSAQNAHIVGWDNLPELAKLVGEKVTSITYVMPDSTYIYTFDGIYIKPDYSGSETVAAPFVGNGSAEVTITSVPEALEDVTVTMDSAYDSTQTYTVKVSSSNYADIIAALPISSPQREQLTALSDQAKALIENGTAAKDDGLIEHYEEAIEMLEDSSATSAKAAELITELTGHLSVYITSDTSAH